MPTLHAAGRSHRRGSASETRRKTPGRSAVQCRACEHAPTRRASSGLRRSDSDPLVRAWGSASDQHPGSGICIATGDIRIGGNHVTDNGRLGPASHLAHLLGTTAALAFDVRGLYLVHTGAK